MFKLETPHHRDEDNWTQWSGLGVIIGAAKPARRRNRREGRSTQQEEDGQRSLEAI
ncbi:hypothetical protein EX30DRAFT_340248 [Ascodesmis nigricans]|uniref:Uncharacterized protein n=1 Tax=Ascodesmis nigricans TaxID=341454 RepID=A0A4S2MYQ9_9PEZI|nr:hypothetical protein EX30DRAFT_340248 [Ascodesmis nigricans]